MGNAEKANLENDLIVPEADDIVNSDEYHAHDLQDTTRPKIWLPSFMISDFAVMILFLATLGCLFGLSRQLMLLWEVSQEGRILDRAVVERR